MVHYIFGKCKMQAPLLRTQEPAELHNPVVAIRQRVRRSFELPQGLLNGRAPLHSFLIIAFVAEDRETRDLPGG